MNNLVDLVKKFGVDTDTINHIEWILKMDKSLVKELIDGYTPTNLNVALVDIGQEKFLWDNSIPIITRLFQDCTKDKWFDLNKRVKMRMEIIQVQSTNLSNSYIVTANIEVVVDGVHTYAKESAEQTIFAQKKDSIESSMTRLSWTMLGSITTKDYFVSDDPLQLALTFKLAAADIENIVRIFDALGKETWRSALAPIHHFLRECERQDIGKSEESPFYDQVLKLRTKARKAVIYVD